MGIRDRLRQARDGVTVLLAALAHPRTPWTAKAMALVVVAYAVSPVDLIPDPIPVLGLLDDALLVPLGIWLTLRLVPNDVLAECRSDEAAAVPSWLRATGVAFVLATWAIVAAAAWWLLTRG